MFIIICYFKTMVKFIKIGMQAYKAPVKPIRYKIRFK